MIVFDLKCDEAGHVFEAWFSSTVSFEEQKRRNLLLCPICGDSRIGKALMAPRVGAKGNKQGERTTIPVVSDDGRSDSDAKALLSAMAALQSKMLEDSTWVGQDFDRQARAMDAGEIDRSTIHGQVSRAEAAELVNDGIGVVPLPFPVIPPEKRN